MRVASLGSQVGSRSVQEERKLRYGLKLVVGISLVLWLVGGHRPEGMVMGWRRIAACLAGIPTVWFLLILAAYLAGQSLCAWKWSLLARGLGFRRPLRFYWLTYLGAMFCSLFLPTAVGGDVFRALSLTRGVPLGPRLLGAEASEGGHLPKREPDGGRGGLLRSATVSVLADRGTGVLAMAWIAAVAAAAVSIPRWAVASLDLVCALLTLGFVLPFWLRHRFARSGFVARVLACWDDPRRLLLALGAAFVFQALLGVTYGLLGHALALGVDLRFYFLLCPLVSITAVAPVSINGLGVREAALVALFPLAGVGRDHALAFGLAWSAVITLADLLGGLALFGADLDLHRPDPMVSEQRAGR